MGFLSSLFSIQPNVDKEVTALTKRYKKTQDKNWRTLHAAEDISRGKLAAFREMHDMAPEKMLASKTLQEREQNIRKKRQEQGFFKSLWFGVGDHVSVEDAVEHYKAIEQVYYYYESRFKCALARVTIANARYILSCKKAALYVQQMKELIESFSDKQKKEFDQTGQMELEEIEFSGQKTQELLKSIKSLNKDYDISMKDMWKGTFEFSASMMNDKSMGKLGAALGVGSIIGAGIADYFARKAQDNEIKAKLIEGEAKIRKAITQCKSNKVEAESFMKRADEISDFLENAIERYTVMFSGISKQLFPEGDKSKTKASRKEQEKNGGAYYTDEEIQLIRPLGKYAKALKQITNPEFK